MKKTYKIIKQENTTTPKFNVQEMLDGIYIGYGKFLDTEEQVQEYVKELERKGYTLQNEED